MTQQQELVGMSVGGTKESYVWAESYEQADVLYAYAYLVLLSEISSLSVQTAQKLFWPLSAEKTT